LWLTLSQLHDYELVSPETTLAKRIDNRIKACGGQLRDIALNLDESTADITDVFLEQPPRKHLHIVVDGEWNSFAFSLLRDLLTSAFFFSFSPFSSCFEG